MFQGNFSQLIDVFINNLFILILYYLSADSSIRHPTSCCSIAEIMSVLFFHEMKYRIDKPKHASNDRFVLSKVSNRHITVYIYLMYIKCNII